MFLMGDPGHCSPNVCALKCENEFYGLKSDWVEMQILLFEFYVITYVVLIIQNPTRSEKKKFFQIVFQTKTKQNKKTYNGRLASKSSEKECVAAKDFLEMYVVSKVEWFSLSVFKRGFKCIVITIITWLYED